MDVHYKSSILNIPKDFILNALCSAPETELKVMLILLSNMDSDLPAIKQIAQMANITPMDVDQSIDYWINKGYMSKNPVTEQLEIAFSPVSRFVHPKAYNSTLSDAKSLVGQIEEMRGQRLGINELEIILFIYNDLGFSEELVKYLVEYCDRKDKFFANYIKKVALAWEEEGVKTIDDAKAHSTQYPTEVYKYINMLGKRDFISPIEKETVYKWISVYHYDEQIITKAINKALQSNQNGKIAYTDKVLTEWYEKNVKSAEQLNAKGQIKQGFERDYDFEEIERELVNKPNRVEKPAN
jgi:DnaD/phage-associated family protein